MLLVTPLYAVNTTRTCNGV